jgi:transcriptional regulator with XRE-family HTH domain
VADSTPAETGNPLVQQRMLLSELKRIRDEKRFLQKQVAADLDWSVSKLIRIESGAVGISKSDLIALLHHYRVTDQEHVDRLIEMNRVSRQSAWWDKYKDKYSQQFINFVAFESSSRRIRQFQALAIPGLLQTRDYARFIIELYDSSPEITSMGTEVRLERQTQVLEQPNPPEMFFILDEALIRRQVGGPEVMREQLTRLKELNRRPGITIQIARFQAGAYVGMKGSFTIFEFPTGRDDYAVVLEYGHRDVLIQNDAQQASEFLETFFELEDLAEPSSRTEDIIDEVLATFPGSEPDKKKGAAAAKS